MEDTKSLTKQALEFHQQGKFEDAEKLYQKVLTISPNDAGVLNLLGLLKYQNKDYDTAIKLIRKAVEISPNAYFYDNLGRIYSDCGKISDSVEAFKSALKLEPENFEIWFNLAHSFKQNKQYKNAVKAYRIALKYNPESFEIYFNLGGIFELLDKTETAIDCYKRALKFKPNDIETNYFLAISYLKIKDFIHGWSAFECRASKVLSIITQNKMHPEIMAKKPEWMGEDLSDKVLYVYFEAGFGDTIMFARYIPILAKMCREVVFAPQDALCELFSESFKDIKNLKIITFMTPEKELNFDYHIPIMSLALRTQNVVKGIPFDKGFLKAKNTDIEYFKGKYFNNSSFKIGIKWEGNSEIGLDRIIPVEAFEPISKLPNVNLYSLQKGDGEEDINKCPFEITNLSSEFTDFSKTAAAIENLDLVICNDTSVAHLAGALNKPCWIMLPHSYNWRWHNDLSFSPWYESVKLFRQKSDGNWTDVIDEICSEIKK